MLPCTFLFMFVCTRACVFLDCSVLWVSLLRTSQTITLHDLQQFALSRLIQNINLKLDSAVLVLLLPSEKYKKTKKCLDLWAPVTIYDCMTLWRETCHLWQKRSHQFCHMSVRENEWNMKLKCACLLPWRWRSTRRPCPCSSCTRSFRNSLSPVFDYSIFIS